jgi:hypothetical protein
MKHPPTIGPPPLPAITNDLKGGDGSARAKAAAKGPTLRLVSSKSSAAKGRHVGPSADKRDQLRMLVATIDRELARLSSTATLIAEEGDVDELIVSWDALVRLLAITPGATKREPVAASDADQKEKEPVL